MSQKHSSVKIVIIGAGISGLIAAKYLLKSKKISENNLVILEAQDRIGGRIHTIQHGKSHLEIGAQFIHGQRGNPIYDIAKKLGVLDNPELNDDNWDAEYYTQNGELIDEDLVDDLEEHMEFMYEDADKFFRDNVPLHEPNQSVGNFFDRGFKKYLDAFKGSEHTKSILKGLYKWRLQYENVDNGCSSVYDLSLSAWGGYEEFAGPKETHLKHGYRPIIDHILKKVPDNCIKLNTPVEKIDWSDATADNLSRSVVHCANGDSYSAEYVLVTTSVGYLKENATTMFQPNLPAPKMLAISRIGFNTVDKIFLEFDKRWWDKDCEGINCVYTDDQPLVLHSVDNAYSTENSTQEWYRDLFCFEMLPNQPKIILAWIAGPSASTMETVSEEQVIKIIMELLRKFKNDPDIPDPVYFSRTAWFSNPYVRGAYSFIRPEGTMDDCDTLADPLPSKENPVLLFAGEGTSKSYHSTTHGAYLSGVREAKRILHHLESSNQ